MNHKGNTTNSKLEVTWSIRERDPTPTDEYKKIREEIMEEWAGLREIMGLLKHSETCNSGKPSPPAGLKEQGECHSVTKSH